mmetsp:Transcript_4210/g.3093  ORF Transcript_4210/g.3093 Transcript_4210/m.3093 type:complete len:112 (+) Transcript_4210:82-417(+)|eukprot:CAMPEP_0202957680 /NCGR_PEP_ID=MMETSP1396-20130829/2065_1 /ASSEMBLY_ACC=CAM_ASM_000872 /TAXON_ID= /ORGANISM="Pseudokeronopsis sp., Strain Brazil" /LENGTH=111 /DNA_ID=CAMNT_0049675305 /DNA_START=149 /DNA_END=484 /DNA_ORIENTATION=-
MNGIHNVALSGTDSIYFYTTKNNFMTYQMEQLTTFNTVHIVFYDYDNRDYTLYMDYSTDGSNWVRVIGGIGAKGSITHNFGYDISAKFIRLSGYNTKNDDFHILRAQLDYE